MGRCCMELYAQGPTIFLLFAVWLSLARGDLLPSFVREPKTSVTAHHAPATIFCQVAPSGATVKWLFNGKALQPSEHEGLTYESTNLHFSNFKYSTNEGTYQCIASTSAGSIISQPLVLQKPVLKPFPAHENVNIVASVNGLVVIPCSSPVSLPHRAQVYVQESSGALLSQDTAVLKRLPSGSVLITQVKQQHGGQYRCVAINTQTNHNRTSQHIINLTVQSQAAGPETVIVDASQQKVFPTVGEDVLLECPTSSPGQPQVTWSKYGGTLPQDRTTKQYGNLRISNVKIEDAGTYICQGGSESVQKLIAMEVQAAVSATAVKSSITATAGDRVELRCNISGHPEPRTTWYHNAKPIPSGSSNGGAVFVINKVAPSHGGLYQCQAVNNGSSDSDVMRLEVGGQGLDPTGKTDEPSIGVTESDKGANNETTHESMVKPNVRPTPKKKNHKPNNERKRKKKKKKNRKNRKKKNRKKKKKPRKNEKAILVPPSRPDVQQLSETSVMLNWTVPQNDGLPITFYRVQYKMLSPSHESWHTDDMEIDAETKMYEVSKLKAGGVYKFRIAAVYSNNDNKVGRNSHRFTMSVAPPGEAQPPVEKPTIVEAKPLTVKEGDQVHYGIGIKWQYMLMDASPIEGFFIYYKPYDSDEQYKKMTILETTVRQHVIGYLAPDTEYSIRMLCFNTAGRSDFSNTVVRRTSASGASPTFHPFPSVKPGPGPVKPTPRMQETPPPQREVDRGDAVINTTNNSSQMLYMILGIVIGVMVLMLIFFIVLCMWKQRQQRRMMAMNGVVHAKFQDQAQRIYSESMRKKYMNGYPLNGLNGLVANGHVQHGHGNHSNKMNINVNPMSEMELQAGQTAPTGKIHGNHVPNGSAPQYEGTHSTSDNNFNSINTSKSRDEVAHDPAMMLMEQNGRTTPGEGIDPSVIQKTGLRSPNSLQHVYPQSRGQSSNEADLSSGETSSPRIQVPGDFDFANGSDRQPFESGTNPHVFSARNTMDALSPSDHISGNHGKHKRRRKRPHSREHSTKDQATNTDLSSNEGTIEFSTFNKSPSLSSEKSQSFTNSATQCADYSHMNGAL